jgi:hypothetical protein
MLNTIVSLENTRFNEAIRHNDGGSVFLGYLYAELVVAGILAGDESLKIGCPDLQVRITVNGQPRIDFPQDLKQVKGKPTWVARYFSASKATREEITRLVFSIPAVSSAVETALREQAAQNVA